MSRIERQIVVNAPIEDVYAQWTQFETFPEFMEGVDRVVQVDDQTLTWWATVAGRQKTWNARIVDQTPNVRIAWRSTEGAQNDGAVLFSPAPDDGTEIRLVVDVEPDGIIEEVGDRTGIIDRRIGGDLERFKTFVEERGRPTGSWDGEIHGNEVIEPAGGSAATGVAGTSGLVELSRRE